MSSVTFIPTRLMFLMAYSIVLKFCFLLVHFLYVDIQLNFSDIYPLTLLINLLFQIVISRFFWVI